MSDISGTSSTPSGMTGAGGGNLLRITGMATGLDVDAMVKKMMAAEQTKLDKAKQGQQTIQWKQEAYQDIIKAIKDLQSSFFDSTSSDKNILSSANFSPFAVSGVGGSAIDTSSVTFTPGVGAQTGKYTLSFKNSSGTLDGQLAAAAIIPGGNITLNTSNAFTQSNWDKGTNVGDVAKTIGFSINGTADQVITLNDSHTSLADTINDINLKISANSSLKGKVQAVVNGGNIQFQTLSDSSVKISNTNTTIASDLNNLKGRVINPSTSTAIGDLGLGADDSIKFNYNGTDYSIAVKATDKISDVINNISSKTSGAVTAKFSQLTGAFTIQTTNSGSAQSLTLTASTAASVLGLSDTSNKKGQDAIVYITPPGANTSTKIIKSTNNFTIDGMSYNLSSVSPTDTAVNVGTDTQKVYDKIKSFIDKYNTVVDEIQTKLNEKKDYSYKPLTDSQKSTMSASQITAWETKAKVGILKGDDNLENMLNGLRTAFTTAVNSTGLSFGIYGSNSLGLDTSTDYNKPAHIDIVDASKLKDAISNKSDQVLKFFTNASSLTLDSKTPYDSSTTKYKEDGVFTRIKSILETNVGYTNTTLNSAILTSYANKQYDYSSTGNGGKGTIPDQIYEQQLMIKKITDSMSTKQEKYYLQFSQLETAMNQLNSQQSMLSSMISS